MVEQFVCEGFNNACVIRIAEKYNIKVKQQFQDKERESQDTVYIHLLIHYGNDVYTYISKRH